MNFFKSILSEDPYPEEPHGSESDTPPNPSQGSHGEIAAVNDESIENEKKNLDSSSGSGGAVPSGGGWSFGGLMQSFATRSESVLEIYRRDLQEFRSGLKKETEIIREAASRAVKELPASIEVAHGSLESVGNAFDGMLKSTAGIISQGKETLLASSDVESDTPDGNRVPNSGRYSRFDAQLSALQNDSNTYSEEPNDSEEYKKWKLEFSLEDKDEEVGNLIGENGVLEDLHKRLVPNVVDNDTFWCRYFYRVYKLKQQESMRANLVKRAISVDDEEELSWDIDDDDDENDNEQVENPKSEKKTLAAQTSTPIEEQEKTGEEKTPNKSNNSIGEDKSTEDVDKGNVVVSSEVTVSGEKAISEESSEMKKEDKVVKVDEKDGSSEGKSDHGKDSDVSVISSQPSVHEEEDLGWDEIEDLGSDDDDKKPNLMARGGSTNSADLRRRLSTGEDDEDLSWDIEDDDEPVKA